MSVAARLLREPLLHFLFLGGLLFALYAVVTPAVDTPRDQILITPQRIQQLAGSFENVRKRPPSDDELAALVAGYIREEVYYREALALGLDRDDTIIRRRLMQKLEFLTDQGADAIQPEPGDLDAFLAANARTFQNPPRVSFEQIYLGESVSSNVVAQTLAGLREGDSEDRDVLGAHSYLPAQLTRAIPEDVDRRFGKGFFEQLTKASPQKWSGPIHSTFGVHVIRVVDYEPASIPVLEDVRDDVLFEWRSAKKEELRRLVYSQFRDRYDIVMPEAEATSQVDDATQGST